MLDKNQAVSLSSLHNLYGIGMGDRRYRHYLKERIEKSFKDVVVFLTPSTSHSQYVLVSMKTLQSNPLDKFSSETNLKHVAKSLRDGIIEQYTNLPDLNWPPTIQDLTSK